MAEVIGMVFKSTAHAWQVQLPFTFVVAQSVAYVRLLPSIIRTRLDRLGVTSASCVLISDILTLTSKVNILLDVDIVIWEAGVLSLRTEPMKLMSVESTKH
jgi:hypothetical protein